MEGDQSKPSKVEMPRATDSKRTLSTIEFPYGDLDDAVELATAVHSIGGQSCTVDQLAAFLKQSANSGAFRLRLSFPRIFGLTENERGTVRLTDLGMKVVDSTQADVARVEAFLKVPLYAKVYEKYKGYTLPPASALEREMAAMGVAPKQTDKARQAFDRSARQAGFYNLGTDRLTIPPMKNRPETKPLDAPPATPRNGSGGNSDGELPELDAIIAGLLKRLPKAGEVWPELERKLWLQLLEGSFKLIYKDQPSGNALD